MSKVWRILSAVLLVGALCGSVIVAAHEPQAPPVPPPSSLAPLEGDSSVLFIENVGQFAEGARFQVWGGEHAWWLAEQTIWITVIEGPHPQSPTQQMPPFVASDEDAARGRFAALSLLGERGEPPSPFLERRPEEAESRRGVNLKLSFPGANPHPQVEPFNRLQTRVSYFIGNDPDQWRPDVPVWGGVRYVELYPGVDLEVHGQNGQIVQRVVARPGADLSTVRLRVEGAQEVAVDGQRLRLHTAAGDLTLPLLTVEGAPSGAAPMAFHPAPGTWELQSPFASASAAPKRAARAAGASDLVYATFLGGSSFEICHPIAVDASGAAYMAGWTSSCDFPTSPGAFDTTLDGGVDAFVAKLNSAGSGLAYATFLGGSDEDLGWAVAVDASGAAYVAGRTYSSDLPTSPAAFDTTYNADEDTFVAKLDPAGSALVYATFLGGSNDDECKSIGLDASGAAYVAGSTASSDFPTTPAAFDTTLDGYHDAFLAKLNPAGSALAYATFLGGSDDDYGLAMAVHASDAAYVAGATWSFDFPTTPAAFDTTYGGRREGDGFVAKLNPEGSALAYATFLGGSYHDLGYAIAVDASGAAYVAGWTESSDFPATPGAFDTTHNGMRDAFVASLDSAGSGLAYATFLGGADNDYDWAIAVDASGAAYLTGHTESSDFPTTPAAFDTTHNDGCDAFVARLNSTGSGLAYATFLGGSGGDYGRAIAVEASGAAYIAGDTHSSDFPTTPGAFDTTYNQGYRDAFVAKLVANQQPTLGTITPSDGSGPAGVTAYFTTTWSDIDGWQDLQQCYFHVGASPSMVGNVTLLYSAHTDKLWLRSDDGSQWTGGHAPGSANVLENGQAIVHCEQTTVQGADDTLSVTWAIEFKPAFAGAKKLGLMARDTFGAKAKGAWKGTWTVVQSDLRFAFFQYWGPDEYVMITSQGADVQDMTGWQLQSVRGDQWYSFPAGYTLPAGSYVRVHSGPDAWRRFPTDLKWTMDYTWHDEGDEARLYEAHGGLVDSWAY